VEDDKLRASIDCRRKHSRSREHDCDEESEPPIELCSSSHK
jgi:hypothetical protein